MPLRHLLPAARLLALCALAAPALAATDGATLPARDVSLLAAACANCHGPAGIPALHGQPAERLAERMTAFKTGPADAGATVMPRLMQGYDAQQIQALAQWFASQPTQP